MNKILLLGLVLALTSCCSNSIQAKSESFVLTNDQQELLLPFSKVNERLFYLIGKGEVSTFEKLDFVKYESYLETLETEHPKKLKKLLNDFSIKKIFPKKDNFIVCIYSQSKHYGVCDDPSCPGIEPSQFFNGEMGNIETHYPKESCK